MDNLKTNTTATGMDDETDQENLINLKRLKDGYTTIADKMGYGKFKPYLHRLFHSIEIMFVHEETEFKKIDAKYRDMVRQCHIYEKTLSMMKENNYCELSSFSESSNTYALEDLTRVTPYLAPDILQSTLGANHTAGGSTSMQFRLPRRRSSLSNRQYVSTPLGPSRTSKPAVPLAHFDDDSSFGFQQQKQFVDATTEPIPIPIIRQQDFSCQMTPLSTDQQIETIPCITEYQSTQTDIFSTESIACQINPHFNHCFIQTDTNEQRDFSAQFMPTSIDQNTETISQDYQTQTIQTDFITTEDYACQTTPDLRDQQIETTPILTEEIAVQSSFALPTFNDQEIQTDLLLHIDVQTQYESLSIEELPIFHEIEIVHKYLLDQECQTSNIDPLQSNQSTQTRRTSFHDCSSQSPIICSEDQSIQTEYDPKIYSSSLLILPTEINEVTCSSKLVIFPREVRTIFTNDQEIQCELLPLATIVPIPIEKKSQTNDRRSIIQQQMDEKEKQMNRIIEEYAALYGEYEVERRRNMDLTEARDRLADHIKVLSDELGDREINQEKLLIKSCQQNKLINYMLPHIDCSPTPRKKHHSASSFRRLLPKFK